MGDEVKKLTDAELAAGYDLENPSGLMIGLTALGIVVTLIAVFLFVQFYWLDRKTDEYSRKVEEAEHADINALHAQENAELGTVSDEGRKQAFKVLDKAKGVVHLPLPDAMKLVAQGYATGKPTYGTAAVRREILDKGNVVATDGGAAAPAAAAPAAK